MINYEQNGSCDQKNVSIHFFQKLYYLISVLGKVAKGAHKKFGIGNSFPFILFSYQFFGKLQNGGGLWCDLCQIPPLSIQFHILCKFKDTFKA